EADVEKRKRTANTVGYVGMWHTYPNGDPLPSPTDLDGMRRLCGATNSENGKQLLVILGRTNSSNPSASAYVFSGRDFAGWSEGQFARACAISLAGPSAASTRRRV